MILTGIFEHRVLIVSNLLYIYIHNNVTTKFRRIFFFSIKKKKKKIIERFYINKKNGKSIKSWLTDIKNFYPNLRALLKFSTTSLYLSHWQSTYSSHIFSSKDYIENCFPVLIKRQKANDTGSNEGIKI